MHIFGVVSRLSRPKLERATGILIFCIKLALAILKTIIWLYFHENRESYRI